ncbi:hypothetical protein AGDE_05740 [Angomonas deanei]|uniref:Uncharacterized protein n=1 Tax=Angomonas deanei TaxID=59799 RepID=A0A7G2CQQ0_9TRYP|nr:hypothetical protein AGDE_05740 [Angomonas deanei]CAD2221321.1 hypothetical protein, conserved [Angomonas deanei]|eukprot:EPY38191.1 hypothetical protein AGDE_05740 [Angomonas deanei]
MPNPYTNNTEAAYFVDYYGSKRMLQDSTNRLYNGGVRRKKEAVRRVEQEVYNRPPTVRRTQQEIDEYLRVRVEEELLRRQQHRVELARELYPTTESPPRYLTGEEFQRHVKHVYTDPMRRRELREREIEKVFGKRDPSVSPNKGSKRRSQKSPEDDAPAPWRPSSASLQYNDGQQYLVSQYAYYADPKKSGEVLVRNSKGSGGRAPNYNRLTDLARPLSVTPKVVDEETDGNQKPPFRVDRKISYQEQL